MDQLVELILDLSTWNVVLLPTFFVNASLKANKCRIHGILILWQERANWQEPILNNPIFIEIISLIHQLDLDVEPWIKRVDICKMDYKWFQKLTMEVACNEWRTSKYVENKISSYSSFMSLVLVTWCFMIFVQGCESIHLGLSLGFLLKPLYILP